MADAKTNCEGTGFRDPEPFGAEIGGQRLTLYPAGANRRAALLEMLRGARTSLKLAFYIFAEDRISREVRDELVAAARRGVEVVLLIDRFGAAATDEFLDPIKAAGGEHLCFSAHWTQRYLIRNHQKMVIVDRLPRKPCSAGFNVEDGYFAAPDRRWVG